MSDLNVLAAQATALFSERILLDEQNRRLAATTQLLKKIARRWKAPSSSMQVARTATNATVATRSARTPRATGWLAQLQRIDQGIEALGEKQVDFPNDAIKLGSVEVALHHVDDVLHQ